MRKDQLRRISVPTEVIGWALVAGWKDADRGMAAIAEVIARAFASGMSWSGAIDRRPLYCPPRSSADTGSQVMSVLDCYVVDHPELAGKTYGFALSASLRRAFPCAPH